jgi:hypothetical protein
MRQSTLALLACCGALAAVIFIEASYYNSSSDAPLPTTEETSIRSYTDARAQDLTFDPPPISHFREIIERPLFSSTRRPVPADTREPMNVYRLRGIFLSEQRNIGLVERRSDGVLIRLSEGDLVDEWEVAFVESETIGFSHSGQIYRISIVDTIEELSRPYYAEMADAEFDGETHEDNTEDQVHKKDTGEEFHEVDIEVHEVDS